MSAEPPPAENWNQNPRPFTWTKTAEEILDSLARYIARISDAGHQPPARPTRTAIRPGHHRPRHRRLRHSRAPRKGRRLKPVTKLRNRRTKKA